MLSRVLPSCPPLPPPHFVSLMTCAAHAGRGWPLVPVDVRPLSAPEGQGPRRAIRTLAPDTETDGPKEDAERAGGEKR